MARIFYRLQNSNNIKIMINSSNSDKQRRIINRWFGE